MYKKSDKEAVRLWALKEELKEKEKDVLSIRRVQEGKSVSIKDLDRVRRVAERKTLSSSKGINLNYIALELEKEVHLSKNSLKRSKENMKRRGIDLERVGRQRRIHQVKELNEKNLEKEMEL